MLGGTRRLRAGSGRGRLTVIAVALLAAATAGGLAGAGAVATAGAPTATTAAVGEIEQVPAHFTGADYRDIRAYGHVKLRAGRTYGIEVSGLVSLTHADGTPNESVREEDAMYCVRSTFLAPCTTNEPANSLRLKVVEASLGPGRADVSPDYLGFADFAGLAVPGFGGPNHTEVPYDSSHVYRGRFKPTQDGYLYVLVRGSYRDATSGYDTSGRASGGFTITITGDTSSGGGGGGTRVPLPAAPRGKGPNVNSAFSISGKVRSASDPNVKQAALKGVCGLNRGGARRGSGFSSSRSFGSFTYRDTTLLDDLLGEALKLTVKCTGGGTYRPSGGTSREVETFKVKVADSSDSEACTEGEKGTLTVTSLAKGTDKVALSIGGCDRKMTWTSSARTFGVRVQAQRR